MDISQAEGGENSKCSQPAASNPNVAQTEANEVFKETQQDWLTDRDLIVSQDQAKKDSVTEK